MTGQLLAARGRRIVAIAVLLAMLPAAGASAQQVSGEQPPTTHGFIQDGAELDAAAWVVMEGATGEILASHDAESLRAVASTIKVLTALVVLEHAAIDDVVTVGDEVRGVAGAGVGLEPGDTWSVAELLDALIARSGNDAAETLAVHVADTRDAFVDLMRHKAREIGMAPLALTSPSGLGDENLVSAVALAQLSRAALDEPRLRPFLARRMVDLPTEGLGENRNSLLFTYPGATGIKTGFTRAAGNSLMASAMRDGREIIAVVLGSSTEDSRFDVATYLLDATFSATRRVEIAPQVTLTRAGGAEVLTMTPVVRTFAHDAVITYRPVAIEPTSTAVHVDVIVGIDVVDRFVLEAESSAPSDIPDGPGARAGAAVVDTVYDVLRTASMSGMLG